MKIDLNSTVVVIKSVKADRQLVYGMVYEPNVLDTHGEMMTAEGIETMAHRFMANVVLRSSIDTQHDNTPNGSYPIESYIAKANDPDGYPVGSWVLGVKVTDADLWDRVKKGEINGFSFEAMVTKRNVVVEIEYDPSYFGETEPNADHTHLFFVRLDDSGVVISGRTSVALDGHWHEILRGTATEMSNNHSHRLKV